MTMQIQFPAQKFRTLYASFLDCLVFGFLLLMSPVSLAADWAAWRGPNRDSSTEENDWTWNWPESGPKVRWQCQVGAGYSCLSILGNKGYTSGYSQGQFVYCVDVSSGEILWKSAIPAGSKHQYVSAAYSTPVTDGKQVYILSNMGVIAAFDAVSGALNWSSDLPAQGAACIRGFAAAPLLYKDLVILNCGFAFNKSNGALAWSNKDVIKSIYASPVLCEANERAPMILITTVNSGINGLHALDPNSGKEFWSQTFNKYPLSYPGGVSEPTLLPDSQVLYMTSCGACRVRYDQSAASVSELMKVSRSSVSPPIFYRGCIYVFSVYAGDPPTEDAITKSRLQCFDAQTGSIKWEKPGMIGTLSRAGDKLLVITIRGKLLVVKAAPDQYEELASAEVFKASEKGRDGCWTMPVLCGGRIYCREIRGQTSTILCLDVARK